MMSLPGLQLNSIPVEEKTSAVHELSSGTEWRFEVAFGEDVEVKVDALARRSHLLHLLMDS